MVELELDRIAAAIAGGAMIGLAASMWLLALGRIAGISGIFAGVLPGGDARGDERALRAAFLGGMLAMGFAMKVVAPSVFGPNPGTHARDLAVMAAAGLLVGIGTRASGGCTSGHGVCGLSRGSARSLVATMTFMAVAMVTVYARRALGWP
jgi:uncharacterized membrane protein YedE/YeeE